MTGIKVSVIIPVFNAGSYLQHCINSLLHQSLSDIEIILVNDGSTDDSKSIIASFAEKSKRIVFIDSKNEGVSAARNKGLAIAKGEYIGFMDADDFAEPAMYQKMYDQAKAAGADLAICNLNSVAENREATARLKFTNSIIDINSNREKELVNLMRFKYDFANWNKIYSTNLIRHNNLRFDERMSVYEDLLFNLYYFQYAQRAVLIEEPLYNYRAHQNSVMNLARHDAIEENNLLFSGFNNFCSTKGVEEGLQNCNAEMRRGFYFAVIPKLYNQVRLNEPSTLKSKRIFARRLSAAHPGLYNYQHNELQGMNGLKKRLLRKGWYFMFALCTAIRSPK